MQKIVTLKLIDGNFLDEEAREILTNIFASKINFHQMKNFSSQERFGKDDARAMKRIPALKKQMGKLELILSKAATGNKKLNVNAEIVISLVND